MSKTGSVGVLPQLRNKGANDLDWMKRDSAVRQIQNNIQNNKIPFVSKGKTYYYDKKSN